MSITQHFGRTHGNAAGGGDPPARRVWVQNVAVNALALQVRLDAVMARSPSPSAEQLAIDKGVRSLIDRALKASKREDPLPTRFGNWWRGTLIEAAYQNLHAAEALIVMLFDDNEIEVEVPEAVARVARGLKADDPRRLAAEQFKKVSPKSSHELRKTIEIGHAWAEQEYSRLRSFRNTILASAASIIVFVALFCLVVALNPEWVPLCFDATGGAYCPTNGASGTPVWSDVVVIALLGILGGALSAAVSIRNIEGTSSPYDVPVALAILKVPFGALTALGALIAIRGNFVPGLSELDSQVQILAYALIFGYAQQLLTGLVDKHAQILLDSLPGKSSARPKK